MGMEKETMLMTIYDDNTVLITNWHRILEMKQWVSNRNFGALSPIWDVFTTPLHSRLGIYVEVGAERL